jgi:hypothetical protein
MESALIRISVVVRLLPPLPTESLSLTISQKNMKMVRKKFEFSLSRPHNLEVRGWRANPSLHKSKACFVFQPKSKKGPTEPFLIYELKIILLTITPIFQRPERTFCMVLTR